MNQEYFTLWILDEVLGLPRDVIRWEIWDYIDYRFILNENSNFVLNWVCTNHEFEIGMIWSHQNIHKFDDGTYIILDKMYNIGNMEGIYWVLNFLIPLLMESDRCFDWIYKYVSLQYSIYHLITLCCKQGDINTIKKISLKNIYVIAKNVVEDDNNYGESQYPLYESWRNHHKELTMYLWNHRCGCGDLIYDEENDILSEPMERE